jgi:hypothetical protein
MEPTMRDVHQDAVLTNVSIKYANGSAIADLVFPRVKVAKDSDLYYKYTRDFRVPDTHRAMGAETKKIGWNVTTDTYFCEEYGLHDDILDRMRYNVDNPLDLDIDTTENLTDALTRDREKRVADIAFSDSFMTTGTTLTGADQWSDYAGSDPLGDFLTAIQTVKTATGRTPNTVVMGEEVMTGLRNHPDLLERIKYTQKGVVTADLLSSLIPGSPRIVVGDIMVDSSQEGDTDSLGYVWGKKVLVAYIEQSPSLRSMSLGYQFYSEPRTVRKWREDRIRADRVEVTEVNDELLVSAECGYLIQGAVA